MEGGAWPPCGEASEEPDDRRLPPDLSCAGAARQGQGGAAG